MAVDLHSRQLFLPPRSSEQERDDKNEAFIEELARRMSHSMFQEHDKLSSSNIGSGKSEMGTHEEGPSLETSLPQKQKDPCRQRPLKVTPKKLEMMKLNCKGCSTNVGKFSNQGLTNEQIRAVQQEQLATKKKNKSRSFWERQAQASQRHESREKIREFQNKVRPNGVKASDGNGRRSHYHPGAGGPVSSSSNSLQPQQQPGRHQQTGGSGMRAIFLGASGLRNGSCGTGVFLPRISLESRKKQGCSPVLIPARVVQALQLHFDQMGVTSGSKVGSFPPLHANDVLVCDSDGICSLEKGHPQKLQYQNDNEMMIMSLPREWTY